MSCARGFAALCGRRRSSLFPDRTPRAGDRPAFRQRTYALVAALLVLLPDRTPAASPPDSAADNGLASGLQVTLESLNPPSGKSAADLVLLPSVALYIPRGESPTPFLAPGKFQATWDGFVSAELRGDYQFSAELRGTLRLSINGVVILDVRADEGSPEPSRPVRLNKGTNALRAVFVSPESGDAYLRLSWIPQGGRPEPIPRALLQSGAVSHELAQAEKRHRGRALLIQYRCVLCHTVPQDTAATEELAALAPSFEGIGARLNRDWLTEWILDPKVHRATARMPNLTPAQAWPEAEAAAAFLASLIESNATPAPSSKSHEASRVRLPTLVEPDPGRTNSVTSANPDQQEAGRSRFDALHCIACHDSPETNEADPARVSLRAVARKFLGSALATFLQRPDAHYPWTGMPDFQLADQEASDLAAYLLARADRPTPASPTPGRDLIEQGKNIVQSSGCLNCHSLRLENRFTAKPLMAIAADAWNSGCLAEVREYTSRAPTFPLSPSEREALQEFGRTDRRSIARTSAIDFAERYLERLRCAECHGKFDGFPNLDALSGKLRPEWALQFIGGQLPERPRPWLSARMPAFRAQADGLARGMARRAGYPPTTPVAPLIDPEKAKVGQKLVSAEGGLSCIACHAVAKVKATQVFENAGINLALAHSRLLKPYYERWLRNPLAIDPVTKMPAFFDEEMRSVLLDVYEGNGAQQIEAIWQYLRLGDQMPPPPGTQPGE